MTTAFCHLYHLFQYLVFDGDLHGSKWIKACQYKGAAHDSAHQCPQRLIQMSNRPGWVSSLAARLTPGIRVLD